MYTSPTARIHHIYDPQHPPDHPGDKWTRFICLSDTHSRTDYSVPPGDVLLHAGDLSSWGHYRQLAKTVEWIRTLPHPVKVLIAGNHDLCLDEQWAEGNHWHKETGQGIPVRDVSAARALMRSEAVMNAGIHYLEYESTEITLPNGQTWEFYGSPAVPKHVDGAFQYVGQRAGDEIYNKIPHSTDILLTHTPAYGIHDLTKKHKHAGCKSLANHLKNEQLVNCRLHVFGHIHEAAGASIQILNDEELERVSVNAAMHNSALPVIVDLLH